MPRETHKVPDEMIPTLQIMSSGSRKIKVGDFVRSDCLSVKEGRLGVWLVSPAIMRLCLYLHQFGNFSVGLGCLWGCVKDT